MTLTQRKLSGQTRNAFTIYYTIRDEAHGAAHEVGADVPLRRAGRSVGSTSFAGAKPRHLGRRGTWVEMDVGSPGPDRRAARSTVDPGSFDGCEKPTVKAAIATLDRPVPLFKLEFHVSDDGNEQAGILALFGRCGQPVRKALSARRFVSVPVDCSDWL